LDADHPENGVLIPCRFTDMRPGVKMHVRPLAPRPMGEMKQLASHILETKRADFDPGKFVAATRRRSSPC
jgi:hypothetical protein